jgi:hypothetical protein
VIKRAVAVLQIIIRKNNKHIKKLVPKIPKLLKIKNIED